MKNKNDVSKFHGIGALLCALMLSSCYTSHVSYQRSTGTWTRTVAFGPGAEIEITSERVQAKTRRSPGAAMAGGAFVGSAVGSFLRSAF